MLKQNIKSIFKYFLVSFGLIFFVASSHISFIHNVTHHQETYQNTTNIADPILHNNVSDSSKEAIDCALCMLANYHSQILFSVTAPFIIMAFYLAFISRYFNKVKLSYLLSSYSSRAPPHYS